MSKQPTASRPSPGSTGASRVAELELDRVTVRFGGLVALSDAALTVRPHTVHGVIGPNGAGKTTLFNVACGFVRPDEGQILRRGEHLTRLRPSDLPGLGMARTLQGLGLFDRVTVLDNVMIGADRHARTGFWASALAWPTSGREERALRERALGALAELGIADLAPLVAGSLPYPLRKKVALARALVGEPELLLLDEPASGLAADEIDDLGELVRGLTDRMAVLLVEHHMDLVMRICDDITVLDFGRVIAHGPPEQVRNDPAVLEAYLGEDV
ncbi:ABC transporter ATP-binding protein [Nocardioides gilvus]|uniref:ABC transporter ATP-binding protein n=1 Tax=Nocardioides gilvus TaxID=1735589 RepID=UPI001EF44FC3|nr:ABC transporter ATP-binding protein [Nocardioides gilvus]